MEDRIKQAFSRMSKDRFVRAGVFFGYPGHEIKNLKSLEYYVEFLELSGMPPIQGHKNSDKFYHSNFEDLEELSVIAPGQIFEEISERKAKGDLSSHAYIEFVKNLTHYHQNSEDLKSFEEGVNSSTALYFDALKKIANMPIGFYKADDEKNWCNANRVYDEASNSLPSKDQRYNLGFDAQTVNNSLWRAYKNFFIRENK